MKAEKLNSWVTLGANLGVVVGLILLIIEIQQNTNMMEAQINQSRTEAAIELQAAIFNSEFMPSIIDKVDNGEELNGEETERYTRYFIAVMRVLDNQLWQYSRGFLGTNTPQSVAGAVRVELGRSDLSMTVWDRVEVAFSDEFIAFVDEAISDQRSPGP